MTHEERCAKMLEAIDKFAFEGEMIDYAWKVQAFRGY